jgi:O-antigen/teichoic acid export membrane protein
MEQSKNSVASNFLYSLFIILIIGIVNLGYPLLIGLLYSPETMGNFSILFNWSFFLAIPIANGIAPAISRFIAASKGNETSQLNRLGEKLTIFYLILAMIIFPLIGVFLFHLTIYDFLIVMFMLVAILFHYLFRYSLQGQERFRRLFKLELIAFAFFIPFMILFGVLPNVLGWTSLLNLHWLFLPIIMYHVIFDILFFFIEIKRINLKKIFSFPEITKKILLYALLVGAGSLFSLGISQFQIIISDNYLGEFEVGVLGFWDSAIKPISLISVAIGALTVPRITNLRKSEERHDIPFVNSMNYGLTLLLMPLFGLVFLIIAGFPNIFDYLGIAKYQTSTYWWIPILLGYQILNNLLATPTISFYSSSEKKVIVNPIVSFVYSLIVILSWLLLVPKWGIWGFASGIAIGSLFFSFLIQIIVLFMTKGRIGLHLILSFIFTLLGVGSVFLLQYTLMDWLVIMVWTLLLVPSIVFGIRTIVKVLKNKDYSTVFHELPDSLEK